MLGMYADSHLYSSSCIGSYFLLTFLHRYIVFTSRVLQHAFTYSSFCVRKGYAECFGVHLAFTIDYRILCKILKRMNVTFLCLHTP